MVTANSRRRRANPRRRSRRTNNLARRIALVAKRCPIKSRLPRDPPPIPEGYDHVIRVAFLVRMFWNSDSTRTTAFSVTLASSPVVPNTITLYARHAGVTSNRSYYLDYDEIWASAYMKATGQHITSSSSTTRAAVEFSLQSVKVWGPLSGGGGLTLRIDGGPTLSGEAASDVAGRNTRAAIGFTFPTRDWQAFSAIDSTTPAVFVALNRVGLSALAPEAAGTSFGFENQIDMGVVHCTVGIRYKIRVSNAVAAGFAIPSKDTTVFSIE